VLSSEASSLVAFMDLGPIPEGRAGTG